MMESLGQNLDHLSLSEVEYLLELIDQQRDTLATSNMLGGVGAVGYRSGSFEAKEQRLFVQIDLADKSPVDQLILVPIIYRDSTKGFIADAFPAGFRVILGTDDGEHEVCRFDRTNQLLPRVAPLLVECAGVEASWVRIETTELSPRAWDGRFILQFSEIMVFRNLENLALRQAVTVSSTEHSLFGAWHEKYMVDGFVPYLMDAREGEQSHAYVSPTGDVEMSSLMVDLGAEVDVDEIHYHAADLSDNVPQSHESGFGIPERFVFEGALQSDFSDAIMLAEIKNESVYDVGPVIMRRFPKRLCRYIRLVIKKPCKYGTPGNEIAVFGIAELEVFSKGLNVAFQKEVTSSGLSVTASRSLSGVTDGNNFYGRILSIRTWLEQLALRHDLEVARPRVASELRVRYQRQSAKIRGLVWLAVLLGGATVGAVLIERVLRQRAIGRTRERLAADLHDELGANLHALSLLGDLAQRSTGSPKKLSALLDRMRALSKRSGEAARYCSNLIESKGLFEDLVHDMEKTTSRMMADLDHTMTIEGAEHLDRLSSRNRIDLFLFFKECIVNVLRHSGATKVTTQLVAGEKEVSLVVCDNGRGLGGRLADRVPSSLSRRARLLGARVTAEDIEPEGTRISLSLRHKRFFV
ncbi:Signal transduction histidine kinase [Neorhodopirellula lusitana]|uniref:histidine kinase n=1 Tax=Neorhodopirellula lusitana TaxID=445327 RepID=A0ABY1QFS3_9BACT|nr:histidine kinase [Neorhodopirellula lusitana]SMP69398.1 Signal transduction histidine kinase [Neorhodopirellula lusitana]